MMVTSLTTRTTCRVCDGELPDEVILDLGDQQIATGFGRGAVKRRVPLQLARCHHCGLVQLWHTVPPAILYSSYWYQSGVNQTMTDNLHQIATQAEWMAQPTGGDYALDIGCNDGTLLDGFLTPGLKRAGFDPSDIAEQAIEKGYEIFRGPFSSRVWRQGSIMAISPKIITSIAMFYDLDDPGAFVHEVASILHKHGVWVIELHYLPAMLASNGYDAIVHEHLCYYSLAVIERLLGECGLEAVDAEVNGVNGGSLRLFVRHAGYHKFTVEQRETLRSLRVAEFELGLDTSEPYEEFADSVRRVTHALREELMYAREKGKTVHVYGASTKGNTILQHASIGPTLVHYAADRNPSKWGTETATGIPIISEDDSRALSPDCYLVLPWHFLDEFIGREADFLARGGEFIVPLPEVRTVGAAILA